MQRIGLAASLVRRLVFGGVIGAVLFGGLGFSANVLGIQNQLCAAPIGQPALSDSCGALGLGDRPTNEERTAWASMPVGSCAALRVHVERYPDGAYRAAAADLLTARRTWVEQTWISTQQTLALYVGRDAPALPTEAEAKAAAMDRGVAQASRRCRDFAASGLHRFQGATAQPQEWLCENEGAGTVCGFDGRAVCQLDERHDVEHEACGGRP